VALLHRFGSAIQALGRKVERVAMRIFPYSPKRILDRACQDGLDIEERQSYVNIGVAKLLQGQKENFKNEHFCLQDDRTITTSKELACFIEETRNFCLRMKVQHRELNTSAMLKTAILQVIPEDGEACRNTVVVSNGMKGAQEPRKASNGEFVTDLIANGIESFAKTMVEEVDRAFNDLKQSNVVSVETDEEDGDSVLTFFSAPMDLKEILKRRQERPTLVAARFTEMDEVWATKCRGMLTEMLEAETLRLEETYWKRELTKQTNEVTQLKEQSREVINEATSFEKVVVNTNLSQADKNIRQLTKETEALKGQLQHIVEPSSLHDGLGSDARTYLLQSKDQRTVVSQEKWFSEIVKTLRMSQSVQSKIPSSMAERNGITQDIEAIRAYHLELNHQLALVKEKLLDTQTKIIELASLNYVPIQDLTKELISLEDDLQRTCKQLIKEKIKIFEVGRNLKRAEERLILALTDVNQREELDLNRVSSDPAVVRTTMLEWVIRGGLYDRFVDSTPVTNAIADALNESATNLDNEMVNLDNGIKEERNRRREVDQRGASILFEENDLDAL
jgi:hypothetical protein